MISLSCGIVVGQKAKMDRGLMMEDNDAESYYEVVRKIAGGIRAWELDGLEPLFTEDGWQDFMCFMNYGKVGIVDDGELGCFENDGTVVCRGLSCEMMWREDKALNETLSFGFDGEGKVSSVSLGIGTMEMNDILTKSKWGVYERKDLISFLEDYRTAVALKDIEMLKAVFAGCDNYIADEAFVRKMNGNATKDIWGKFHLNEVDVTKLYGEAFASEEYVNLDFTNLDVAKTKPDYEVYAIQLHQEWHSSTEGDSAYVYIMLRWMDNQRCIVICTFQNAPDPELGIFGPGSF